jgi:uncharacterized membrane protein
MAKIKKSILVEAPLDKVWGVATDANRWSSWYAGLSDVVQMTGDGGVGSVVEQKYLMAGIEFPVSTEVLEADLGSNRGKWKGTIGGPLAGEQTWTYSMEGTGTRVAVDMEYSVPGSVLGKFADRLVLERMQANSMEQTLENLKAMCEVG